MVSPVRFRLILPLSNDATHHAIGVIAIYSECRWERLGPMGEFQNSNYVHFLQACKYPLEQSSAAFSQKFEFSNYLSPFILLISCMCEDLQSLESVWWTKVGDCLDSPFLSDGSHDAATSNCQLRCLWNIQLFGVINIRCSHRMVPQWKIHNQQWYSRKQQVSRSFNFSLHRVLRYDIDMECTYISAASVLMLMRKNDLEICLLFALRLFSNSSNKNFLSHSHTLKSFNLDHCLLRSLYVFILMLGECTACNMLISMRKPQSLYSFHRQIGAVIDSK